MDNKFFAKSKTIWGLIIAALPQLALLFGFDFSDQDASELNDLVLQLVSVAGLIWAAIGRFKAKNNLTLKP